MFLEYLENDGKRYFNLSNEPLLVEVSINSGEVLKCTRISGTFGQVGLYTKIFYYNEKILLVPMHAESFILYDIKSGVVDSIAIPQKDMANENYGFFIKAVQHGQFIYAFGFNYPGIVKIDMENKTAELKVNYTKIGLKGKKVLRGLVHIGANVFTAVEKSCQIGCFNIKTEQFSIIEIGTLEDSFIAALCTTNQGIWIVADNGMIYKYSITDGNIKKISNYIDYLGNKITILHSVYFEGKIFLFPFSGSRVHCFDCELERWMSIDVPIKERQDCCCFYYVFMKNQELSFFCEVNNQFYTYNVQKQIFEKSKKQISDSEYTRLMMKREDIEPVRECESLPLKSYLDFLIEN